VAGSELSVDELIEIQKLWQRNGIKKNVWQSNGRSICYTENDVTPHVDPTTDLFGPLYAKSRFGRVQKIMFWTVDLKDDQIAVLDNGYDIIETSEARMAWELILSSKYNQCRRLATWNDSPWSKVNPLPQCKPYMATPSYGPSYGNPIQQYQPVPQYNSYIVPNYSPY